MQLALKFIMSLILLFTTAGVAQPLTAEDRVNLEEQIKLLNKDMETNKNQLVSVLSAIQLFEQFSSENGLPLIIEHEVAIKISTVLAVDVAFIYATVKNKTLRSYLWQGIGNPPAIVMGVFGLGVGALALVNKTANFSYVNKLKKMSAVQRQLEYNSNLNLAASLREEIEKQKGEIVVLKTQLD